MAGARNSYFNLDANGQPEPIDVFHPKTFERGKDYYIDVFRLLEEQGEVSGLTFYLSELPPERLPRVSKDVVLVVVADEAFRARPYYPQLGALVRTYSAKPYYGYGVPIGVAQRSGLVQHLYKSYQQSASTARSAWTRKDLSILGQARRTLHAPLGPFFRFRPEVRPVAERRTSFAFLGSVEYGNDRKRSLHKLVQPPKLASRAALLKAIEAYARQHGDRGNVRTTGDFEESIQNQAGYIRALQDCQISLCPRGSNPETYRFFESCAAGCVVISEPLPQSWFYDGNPALVLRDWRELPALLSSLLDSPERVQQLSTETRRYWERSLSERAVALRLQSFLRELGLGRSAG